MARIRRGDPVTDQLSIETLWVPVSRPASWLAPFISSRTPRSLSYIPVDLTRSTGQDPPPLPPRGQPALYVLRLAKGLYAPSSGTLSAHPRIYCMCMGVVSSYRCASLCHGSGMRRTNRCPSPSLKRPGSDLTSEPARASVCDSHTLTYASPRAAILPYPLRPAESSGE